MRGNDTKFTSFISEFALLDADSRRERMSLAHPRVGRELPVEVVSGKVMNERGEPIAIVSVLHDLTKQVENERLYEALKQLNSELEERIRAATADLGRAERAAPVAVAGSGAREQAQVGIPREHVARAAHADQRAASATRRCCSTACSAT